MSSWRSILQPVRSVCGGDLDDAMTSMPAEELRSLQTVGSLVATVSALFGALVADDKLLYVDVDVGNAAVSRVAEEFLGRGPSLTLAVYFGVVALDGARIAIAAHRNI